MKKVLILSCVILAVITAIVYLLTGMGVVPYGDFGETDGGPPFIFFVAGAFYILVGYLVSLEKTWLRITLSVINALVIVIFFQMWAARPDVLMSPAGLGTKIAQLLLEIGIIYLVLAYRQKGRRISPEVLH